MNLMIEAENYASFPETLDAANAMMKNFRSQGTNPTLYRVISREAGRITARAILSSGKDFSKSDTMFSERQTKFGTMVDFL